MGGPGAVVDSCTSVVRASASMARTAFVIGASRGRTMCRSRVSTGTPAGHDLSRPAVTSARTAATGRIA